MVKKGSKIRTGRIKGTKRDRRKSRRQAMVTMATTKMTEMMPM